MEKLNILGGKFKTGGVCGNRSSGSTSSKVQHFGATLTFALTAEERVTKNSPVPQLTRKNSFKREHEETNTNPVPAAKKVAFKKPLVIGEKNGTWAPLCRNYHLNRGRHNPRLESYIPNL
ncbi:hypothetical protein Hanom_Chr07g00627211 [Helianthus anomalus]